MPKQLANKHYVRQYSLGWELLRSHYRRLCRREIISIERFVGRVFLVVDPSIKKNSYSQKTPIIPSWWFFLANILSNPFGALTPHSNDIRMIEWTWKVCLKTHKLSNDIDLFVVSYDTITTTHEFCLYRFTYVILFLWLKIVWIYVVVIVVELIAIFWLPSANILTHWNEAFTIIIIARFSWKSRQIR